VGAQLLDPLGDEGDEAEEREDRDEEDDVEHETRCNTVRGGSIRILTESMRPPARS
jgi:hypothetical protein